MKTYLIKIFIFSALLLSISLLSNYEISPGPEVKTPTQQNEAIPKQPKTSEGKVATNTISATNTPIKKEVAKTTTSNITPKTPIPNTSSTTITQTQNKPLVSLDTINENARKAVVNILCTSKSSGPLASITGSGIVISEDGLILTNAHIAQYFLLKDFDGKKDFITCNIRTGNPAYPTYTAELVYISPSWVAEHKGDIILENPKGTGEFDYAFVRITGHVDGSPFNLNLPFISINLTQNTEIGTNAIIVSYPAGFLGGQSILRDLYQGSAVINVSDRYTFGENTVDLISLGGSVVAQKGSSGGAVVDSSGSLIGLVTTSSSGTTTDSRELRAITPSYISRDLLQEAKISIFNLIKEAESFAQTFNSNVSPTLTKTLSDVILKK